MRDSRQSNQAGCTLVVGADSSCREIQLAMMLDDAIEKGAVAIVITTNLNSNLCCSRPEVMRKGENQDYLLITDRHAPISWNALISFCESAIKEEKILLVDVPFASDEMKRAISGVCMAFFAKVAAERYNNYDLFKDKPAPILAIDDASQCDQAALLTIANKCRGAGAKVFVSTSREIEKLRPHSTLNTDRDFSENADIAVANY